MKRIKTIILSISIILFCFIIFSPAPQNLSIPAKNSMAVFILCVALWVTNALPLSVTGLIAIALIPLLKILDSKTTFAYFGNSAVFFILGAFILSTAVMKSGLSKRLALIFLHRFDKSANKLAFGVILTSFFLSFWMPEHAVASFLFPIVLEIAKSLKLKPYQSGYAKILFLSLAWGAIIGGVSTFLGGARNPLAIQMLSESYQLKIGFLEWMVAVVPVSSTLLILAFFLLMLLFRKEELEIEAARNSLMRSVEKMGKISKNEKKVAIIAIMTIIAWILLNKYLDLAVIALLSATSLFIFQAVTWKDVERYINWGIILMYGGAVTLGATLETTGAMKWFSEHIFNHFTITPFMAVMLLCVLSLIMTEVISNVATVATLIPLGFGVAELFHINPVLMVYCIAVPSGLAFCLPIGTPPNAIAFSSGYYRIKDVLFGGIILSGISIIMVLLCVKYYWKLLGISLY